MIPTAQITFLSLLLVVEEDMVAIAVIIRQVVVLADVVEIIIVNRVLMVLIMVEVVMVLLVAKVVRFRLWGLEKVVLEVMLLITKQVVMEVGEGMMEVVEVEVQVAVLVAFTAIIMMEVVEVEVQVLVPAIIMMVEVEVEEQVMVEVGEGVAILLPILLMIKNRAAEVEEVQQI
jgi:hypothetical protein